MATTSGSTSKPRSRRNKPSHLPSSTLSPTLPLSPHLLPTSSTSSASTPSTSILSPVLTEASATATIPFPLPLPTVSSDEDHSSQDGSQRSVSPHRPVSHSSSISDPAVEDSDNDHDNDSDGESATHANGTTTNMDRQRRRASSEKAKERESRGHEKGDGSVSRRGSRSSTISNATIGGHVRRLSATEMQRLTNAPESLPIAPAPDRGSLDQDGESVPRSTADQREASHQTILRQADLWRHDDALQLQSNGRVIEPHAALSTSFSSRDIHRRSSPAPRTLSTPPTSRALVGELFMPSTQSNRRYSSFHSANRPSSLHLNLDGASTNALPSRSNPATAIPLQQTEPPPKHRVASPLPPIIPLPPMSVPTHLQLELAAQRPSPLYIHQSNNYDIPYESNAVKFERLKNVLLIPPLLERTLHFGALACLDAWLHNFTILPMRFFIALGVLFRWWGYLIGKEVKWLLGFVWYGMGRLWQRGRHARSQHMGEISEDERSRSQSRPRRLSTDSTINTTNHRLKPPTQPRRSKKGSFGHKRTKSMPSNLSAFHKADLLQGAVIICSSMALMTLDASRMYHFIRAQSAIKLYVIYNILEVGDRLLSALGQDILECLFSTETLSRNSSGRSKVLLPLGMFLLALAYCCLHSIALYYQVITLNVAVNSYSNALLTLLLSNQFVEIKSTVFKRFEKDNLFQLTCADIVERFQLWVMLFIIGMRNVVEVGGLSVPGAGSESDFDGSSGTIPLHNPSILPHSFTVLPAWLKSGEVLSPFLIVIGSEMLVDTIKHAYVTKFNNIKPGFYSRILDILCKDYYTNAFMTPSLTRRLGLAVIPLSCLFIRASVQTYHMLLSTHLPMPMPMPASTQTSLSEESAVPSSPAIIAALNRFDTLIRDSLGRATYGYPYGSPLNSRAWYSWTSDDFIAAATMIVVFFLAFVVLLIFKLLLGMVLLKYSRNRYARMKQKEYLVQTAQSERENYDVVGSKRTGGFGQVEVGEDRQRWIHADKTEGLKGGKGPGPPPKPKPDGDYDHVLRFEMVAKRIW
ncbi:eukaryotic membrane protein family-domain-containing protein [Mariannaea sp. PMI_226]|nr:eukaryotic membrane protein family-domain-containing protein [Mariannaea sp. PMI_226]